MASWARDEEQAARRDSATCLACGATIENVLTFAASLRCSDCRDGDAPLDPQLVAEWQASGAGIGRLVDDR